MFNTMNTSGPPDLSCAGGAKCVWDGSTMTVTSQVPTCTGATLAGSFHWVTTDGVGNGTSQFTGSYDSAAQLVTLFETTTVVTSGQIASFSNDSIAYSGRSEPLGVRTSAVWPIGDGRLSPIRKSTKFATPTSRMRDSDAGGHGPTSAVVSRQKFNTFRVAEVLVGFR